MFKEKITNKLTCLLVIGVLASSGLAMGKKPTESKKLGVSSEQKEIELTEVKENSEMAKIVSKLPKGEAIEQEETEIMSAQTIESVRIATMNATITKGDKRMTSGVGSKERKVLVLHIIEENWDDLEFILPKYKGRGPVPITKREALKDYYNYYLINTLKLRVEKQVENKLIKKQKEKIKTFLIEEIKKETLPETIKFYVYHTIKYYGKAYFLKEKDIFIKDGFRWDSIEFSYCYNKIPKKISILLEPKSFWPQYREYTPYSWNKFKEIRLVNDIVILSSDKTSNLRIKYDGKEYNLKVGSVLELPIKEKDLTEEEMMKFRERYYKYYKKKYNEPWMGTPEGNFSGKLYQLSVSKDKFHFGTKVMLINYGYIELE
jgi:hypothetical protein